jgi:hypothetical protein
VKTKGLSLAEAHTSGRKYKRPGWNGYTRLGDRVVFLVDALATDYELEPEAKLLTREDVERAVCWLGPTTTNQVLDHIFGEES